MSIHPSVRTVLCWTFPTARGSVCHKTLTPFHNESVGPIFSLVAISKREGEGGGGILCITLQCRLFLRHCGGWRPVDERVVGGGQR